MSLCLKKVHQTKAIAKRAMKIMRQKGWTITCVYWCHSCSGYHLTSMAVKKSRRIGKQSN